MGRYIITNGSEVIDILSLQIVWPMGMSNYIFQIKLGVCNQVEGRLFYFIFKFGVQ